MKPRKYYRLLQSLWPKPPRRRRRQFSLRSPKAGKRTSFEPQVERIAGPKAGESRAEERAVAAQSAPPDMDELVARVLAKMNPDVLQKVTREILKPVIEAIIRDELDSKKS